MSFINWNSQPSNHTHHYNVVCPNKCNFLVQISNNIIGRKNPQIRQLINHAYYPLWWGSRYLQIARLAFKQCRNYNNLSILHPPQTTTTHPSIYPGIILLFVIIISQLANGMLSLPVCGRAKDLCVNTINIELFILHYIRLQQRLVSYSLLPIPPPHPLQPHRINR